MKAVTNTPRRRNKKANRSTRNRHTGRINAAKRLILERGEPMRSSDGRVYKYYQHSTSIGGETIRQGTQVVRDFNAIGLKK